MLFPTTIVGSFPQPDWLIDREKLAGRFPPRTRARELWRIPPQYLAQALFRLLPGLDRHGELHLFLLGEQRLAGRRLEVEAKIVCVVGPEGTRWFGHFVSLSSSRPGSRSQQRARSSGTRFLWVAAWVQARP